jgi:hypothetical protein
MSKVTDESLHDGTSVLTDCHFANDGLQIPLRCDQFGEAVKCTSYTVVVVGLAV